MGYVAIKGGEDAIDNASRLTEYERVKSRSTVIEIEQIKNQLGSLIDKIMGEGSLYAPEHAALALKQVQGCPLEGAFILRAYRATLNRSYYSNILDTRNMRVLRRISSAFREIPGGQILGPTRDYSIRLLDTDLAEESYDDLKSFLTEFDIDESEVLDHPKPFSKVIDILTEQGMMHSVNEDEDQRVVDITREAIKFPAPRSAALQALARAETGGICSLAYSSMRGFGSAHPTVGELRVGYAEVTVRDRRGRMRCIGNIKLTECEVISKVKQRKRDPVPYMTIGYGLCFGHNETKAICMGILDRTMRIEDEHPANSQEFVLYHTEGVESYGFTNHLKLPHYVTFQSGLDNLRKAMQRKEKDEKSKREPQRKTYTVEATETEDVPELL